MDKATIEACAKVCEELTCACCWTEDAQLAAETCADEIRALASQDDCVMVPREPTEEEISAMEIEYLLHMNPGEQNFKSTPHGRLLMKCIRIAMLAAVEKEKP